jgi:hypothetical protein
MDRFLRPSDATSGRLSGLSIGSDGQAQVFADGQDPAAQVVAVLEAPLVSSPRLTNDCGPSRHGFW